MGLRKTRIRMDRVVNVFNVISVEGLITTPLSLETPNPNINYPRRFRSSIQLLKIGDLVD